MNRAYSILTVKSVNEESREIKGVATTPNPDRMGDIVEPLGVKFAPSMPLLWQHMSSKPVGTVKFDKPTKDGITFTAKLASVDGLSSQSVIDRINEAWDSVKSGLVSAVSIGFRALEYAFMEDGGIHFLQSEVLELSLVTIPANGDATITAFKSVDTQVRAALGIKDTDRPVPPGVSGKAVTVKTHRETPKEGKMKTIAEQRKEFLATRQAKAAALNDLLTEGETLDAEHQDAFDAIEAELTAIDKHLKRLDIVEKANLAAATPVESPTHTPTATNPGAAGGDVSRSTPVIRMPTKQLPGLGFAQMVKCLVIGHKQNVSPLAVAEARYSGQADVIEAVKAAVNAATTGVAGNAGNLIATGGVMADFVEFLRPMTLIGKFGSNGVPALRNVPFRVPLGGQATGGSASWVGEGKAKPLTGFTFTQTTLLPLKVAAITVATMELLRDASVAAETLFRDQLAEAVRERIDTDFINPAKAASAGVSPASITNGVSAINSTGDDADAIRADFAALMATYIANDNPPSSAVWVMPVLTALKLSLMQNPLGQTEFPGIGMTGGTLLGIPAIVSDYMPTVTAGAYVAIVNANDIWLGDEGGIDVAVSQEASLEMSDAPASHSDATSTGASLVSMFQTNSVAIRAERTINWAKRRADAVALLNEVNWGAPASA